MHNVLVNAFTKMRGNSVCHSLGGLYQLYMKRKDFYSLMHDIFMTAPRINAKDLDIVIVIVMAIIRIRYIYTHIIVE